MANNSNNKKNGASNAIKRFYDSVRAPPPLHFPLLLAYSAVFFPQDDVTSQKCMCVRP